MFDAPFTLPAGLTILGVGFHMNHRWKKVIAGYEPDAPGQKIEKIDLMAPICNSDTMQARLRYSRTLIITGAVLIPLFAGLEATGLALFIHSFSTPGFGNDLGLGLGFALAAPLVLPPGIVCLVKGLRLRKKWVSVQHDMQLHSGILSNGHIGLALNF